MLNFFHDMLDAVLDPQVFKDLLNAIVLFDALLLSLAMTLPGSIDRQQLATTAGDQIEHNTGVREVVGGSWRGVRRDGYDSQ